MPIQSVLDRSGKFLREATPKPKSHEATRRDYGTVSLSTPIVVLVAWVLHDVVGLDIPVEVAAALATVIGFFIARRFRY